ncbi:MAG TPA: hypothetical protein VJI46_01275 [Candidatus Nanoarchaeia archaeon]|nr:hypothetical protein [Candidatus Nanoarchaeia archaeon]
MKLAFLFLFFLAAPVSLAQGIAVSPSTLDLAIRPGERVESQFTLFNPSLHESLYAISIKNYPGYFAIPDNGVIKANSSEKIKFSVNLPEDASGNLAEVLEISFYSENQGALSIAPGISLKVNLNVIERNGILSKEIRAFYLNKRSIAIVAAVLILGGVIVYSLFFEKEERKQKRNRR